MPPELQRDINRAYHDLQERHVERRLDQDQKRRQHFSETFGISVEGMSKKQVRKALKDQFGHSTVRELRKHIDALPLPLKPQKGRLRSMLDDTFSPYAATSEAIINNPAVHEAIQSMPGTGPGGAVGMVFKRGIPLATQLAKATETASGSKAAFALTENPTTWWIKGSSEIDPKYKGLEEAGRKAQGEEVYSLHPELLRRTGGPAEGRMSITLNNDSKTAKLEFVGVDPAQRGEGWGSELLDSAAHFAKIKGMERVELNALPGPVMGKSGKPVKNRLTGEDLLLHEWYALPDHGYKIQTDQPQVGGMLPMQLDLKTWPVQSKGNLEYELRNRQSKQWIEQGMPSTPDHNPKPAKHGFVPDEMGRGESSRVEDIGRDSSTLLSSVRTALRNMQSRARGPWIRPAYEINASTLARIGVPPDIMGQYQQTGRLPEAWSTLPYAVDSGVSPHEPEIQALRNWYVQGARGQLGANRPPRVDLRSLQDPGPHLNPDPDWFNMTPEQRMGLRNRRIEEIQRRGRTNPE